MQDEQGYLVMGGVTERVSSALAERYELGQSLEVVLREAVTALERQENGNRELAAAQLEVGVLDRGRNGRKFRRFQGAELERLLAATATPVEEEIPADEELPIEEPPAEEAAEAEEPAEPEASTESADDASTEASSDEPDDNGSSTD